MTNAEKVKIFRERHDLTQQRLAEICGCAISAVQTAESGATENPSKVLLGMLRYEIRQNAGNGKSEG